MSADHVQLGNLRKLIELWVEANEPPAELHLESVELKAGLGINQYVVIAEVKTLTATSDPTFGIARKSFMRKLADLSLQVFLHKDILLIPSIVVVGDEQE